MSHLFIHQQSHEYHTHGIMHIYILYYTRPRTRRHSPPVHRHSFESRHYRHKLGWCDIITHTHTTHTIAILKPSVARLRSRCLFPFCFFPFVGSRNGQSCKQGFQNPCQPPGAFRTRWKGRTPQTCPWCHPPNGHPGDESCRPQGLEVGQGQCTRLHLRLAPLIAIACIMPYVHTIACINHHERCVYIWGCSELTSSPMHYRRRVSGASAGWQATRPPPEGDEEDLDGQTAFRSVL